MGGLGFTVRIPIIIRHLIPRVPRKGIIILTTTHMTYFKDGNVGSSSSMAVPEVVAGSSHVMLEGCSQK